VPERFINDLAPVKQIHWMKIVLVGAAWNRAGLNPAAPARSAGQAYTKYDDGKSGYLSQSALRRHFGLSDSKKVESVDISPRELRGIHADT
jgi:ASPIC and UnbV